VLALGGVLLAGGLGLFDAWALNIKRIARLELYSKDCWQVILSDGTCLPVSRSGYSKLRTIING